VSGKGMTKEQSLMVAGFMGRWALGVEKP